MRHLFYLACGLVACDQPVPGAGVLYVLAGAFVAFG